MPNDPTPGPDDNSYEAKCRRFVNLVDQAIEAGTVRPLCESAPQQTFEPEPFYRKPA